MAIIDIEKIYIDEVFMNISQNYPNRQTQYNNNQSPQFMSRNAEIRKLDKICRNVIKEFPVYSNTKMMESSSMTKKKVSCNDKRWKLFAYTDNVISEVRGFCALATSPLEYTIKLLKSVKNLKMGNCSELASVATIAGRINGYNNAKTMMLCAYDKNTNSYRKLYHTVVGINFDKKSLIKGIKDVSLYRANNGSIILDPWAGFTDYSKAANTRIKNNSRFYGIKLKKNEEICYAPASKINSLEDEHLEFFRHEYPNLVEKRKFDIKTKLKWFFTDKKQYKQEDFPIYLKEIAKAQQKLKGALSQDELEKMIIIKYNQ